MPKVSAIYGRPGANSPHRVNPDKCVRIGQGGPATGEMQRRAFWFTLEEAEQLARELAAAILRARAARSGVHEPEPQPAPTPQSEG